MKLECLVCLFVCLFDLGFTLLSRIFQCTNEARVSGLFVCLSVWFVCLIWVLCCFQQTRCTDDARVSNLFDLGFTSLSTIFQSYLHGV